MIYCIRTKTLGLFEGIRLLCCWVCTRGCFKEGGTFSLFSALCNVSDYLCLCHTHETRINCTSSPTLPHPFSHILSSPQSSSLPLLTALLSPPRPHTTTHVPLLHGPQSSLCLCSTVLFSTYCSVDYLRIALICVHRI